MRVGSAIARIQLWTAGMNEAHFKQPEVATARDAVIQDLNVIGQTAQTLRAVDRRFGSLNTGLPLVFAGELCNLFPAGSLGLDASAVWRTLLELLPDLQIQVYTLISNIASHGQPSAGPRLLS